MALRSKTIEYAFVQSIATVATAVARDFTQLAALAIPETVARAFKSVILEIHAQDAETVMTNMPTSVLIGIALGAVARNDVTQTWAGITNSGEAQCWNFLRDVTSYFATNYTGTTMTADARITITGISSQNVSAKLIITYEYQDSMAGPTRIKTVKIPLDGNTGALTTVLTSVGQANQVPALDTFLPELSKVYRDIFFEIYCNDETAAASATNPALNLALDAEAASPDGLHEDANASARSYYRIWKRTDMTTSATHDLKASTDNVNMPFSDLAVILTVTYEYNTDTSTSIIQSLQIPLLFQRGYLGGTVTGDKSRVQMVLMIEEPVTIALVQSGILCSCCDSGTMTIDLRIGSQPSRIFTHPAAIRVGSVFFSRRLDSGAVGGTSGFVPNRGKNTLNFDAFRTTSANGNLTAFLCGLAIINYTSGKASVGDGAHNHTISHILFDFADATTTFAREQVTSTTTAPTIKETTHWLNSVGIAWYLFTGLGKNANVWHVISSERLADKPPNDGFEDIATATISSDEENGQFFGWQDSTDKWDRYPNDPKEIGLKIGSLRRYRCNTDPEALMQSYMLITFHALVFTIAGNVTGFVGDGSGIIVEAHRSDTDEKIDQSTTLVGGAYTMNWYDNTIQVYAHARQDSGHVGRSNDGLAV